MRQASTGAKITNSIRWLVKHNPINWLSRYFTPGPLPKPTASEKKAIRSQRIAQRIIFPAFFGLMGLLFYYEWKDRQALDELKEITYDRRMEMSVDRYKAGTGQAKWDKRKYAKWAEEDKAAGSDRSRITFKDNQPIMVGVEESVQKEKKRRKKTVKEIYEAADNDSTPTLIGQIKGS